MQNSPPTLPSNLLPENAPAHLADSFFKNKRVLITGGAGFIGRALCDKMQTLGAKVVLLDLCAPPLLPSMPTAECHQGDCANLELLARVVPACDVVFSLAGRCGHWDSMIDPLGDMAANTTAPLAVLEACRRWAPSAHVLYAGTRQVYGRASLLPVREDHPLDPVDMNGIHKMTSELQHRLYFKQHGLQTTVLRLTNTYGPQMRVGAAGQTFLGEWLRRLKSGEDLVVFGDGRQLRDLNYVEDVVDAFVCVAAAPSLAAGDVFNLGGKEAVPLAEIARLLIRISGAKLKVLRSPFPSELARIDIGDYQGDFRKIQTRLGWAPRVGLEEGLRRTMESLDSRFASTLKKSLHGH